MYVYAVEEGSYAERRRRKSRFRKKSGRITVHLQRSEREGLEAAASARNMSLNAYIKSRLRSVPENTEKEARREAGFKFHWTCYGAGLMHVVFLLNFLRLHMGMLVIVNCFSIVLYLSGGLFTGRRFRHALPWTIAIYTEILVHALFCTAVQGLDVGFYMYPLMGFPLYAYYLFIYCDRKTFLRTIVSMGVITVLALSAAIFSSKRRVPCMRLRACRS